MQEIAFGMRELYDVVLKTIYPIEINGRRMDSEETIAVFDKIQIATVDELKSRRMAEGGYDNRTWVIWEETKKVDLVLVQGIFSKSQFALMSNSKLILEEKNKPILINKRETLESSEEGIVTLKKEPIGNFFCYDIDTGKKILPFKIENKIYQVGKPYRNVLFDYYYNYTNGGSTLIVGKQLTQSYLTLEGKTKVQDDITGHIKTGIIKIPRLKLMSDLHMKLGENASPMVNTLNASAFPVGDRSDKIVIKLCFLEDDIDSDMD